MNRRGEKPDKLEDGSAVATSVPTDLAEQDSLTRFDKNKMRKKKHRKNRPQHQKPNRPQDDNQAENKNEGEKSWNNIVCVGGLHNAFVVQTLHCHALLPQCTGRGLGT